MSVNLEAPSTPIVETFLHTKIMDQLYASGTAEVKSLKVEPLKKLHEEFVVAGYTCIFEYDDTPGKESKLTVWT